MNRTLTISPVTTVFDFHPFEAHRVGGIVVVTHVSRTNGQEKRTFAALGTCLGGEDGEVKIIGRYKRRRTKKEVARPARQKNAARTRRRTAVRVASEASAEEAMRAELRRRAQERTAARIAARAVKEPA